MVELIERLGAEHGLALGLLSAGCGYLGHQLHLARRDRLDVERRFSAALDRFAASLDRYAAATHSLATAVHRLEGRIAA